jgi:microcompartment protein CcmL/EutN
LSDTSVPRDAAIGLLEFDSIVAGMVAGDAMAKSSPVAALYVGTVHPGRYLVLVAGDTASVEVALEAGGDDTLVDSLFLPDVHPAVVAAITTADHGAPGIGDALGVVETSAAATAIVAADAGVKAADVSLPAIRLSDDLGGKAYCLFGGTVADVEAAVEQAVRSTEHRERLMGATVIAQLHDEMRDRLAAELRFNRHVSGLDGAS